MRTDTSSRTNSTSQSRIGRSARLAIAAAVVSLTAVGIGQSPALAATSVVGDAYGYQSAVSLFGGPTNVLGYGQPGGAPATAATPSVSIASTGGTSSVTDSNGSQAQYGPATIFGWWNAGSGTYGPTGSQTAFATGSISGSGSVTSRAWIYNAGPGPLVMPYIITTCTSTGGSNSGSVSISSGVVETSTYASGPDVGEPATFQNIPSSPSVGYSISGTLDHIGDSFTVVFNERTVDPSTGKLTIVGAHMYLQGPTAVGDLRVAVATCDVT